MNRKKLETPVKQKSVIVPISMSTEQAKLLKKTAFAAELSLSAYVRSKVF